MKRVSMLFVCLSFSQHFAFADPCHFALRSTELARVHSRLIEIRHANFIELDAAIDLVEKTLENSKAMTRQDLRIIFQVLSLTSTITRNSRFAESKKDIISDRLRSIGFIKAGDEVILNSPPVLAGFLVTFFGDNASLEAQFTAWGAKRVRFGFGGVSMVITRSDVAFELYTYKHVPKDEGVKTVITGGNQDAIRAALAAFGIGG